METWCRGSSAWRSVLLIAIFVSGCGGGGAGGDSGDLAVDIAYDSTVHLWKPTRLEPFIDGLEGNSPECRLVAGRLPPGLQLASDCQIVGTPEETGEFQGTIELTVDGYSGSVRTTQVFEVIGPSVTWQVMEMALTGRYHFEGTSWEAPAGAVVTYSIESGELPAGISMNVSTGDLSGVPTQSGIFSFTVEVVAKWKGQTRRWVSANAILNVKAPDFFYLTEVYVGNIGRPIQPLRPIVLERPALDRPATYRYSFWSGPDVFDALPTGLVMNPDTGEISGTPTSREDGARDVGIELTIRRNGVSAKVRIILGFYLN